MTTLERILVTGGMGFIGANFIHYMFDTHPECTIVNLDKLTYAGNPENLRDVEDKENYTFIKGDICDPVAVKEAMKGCGAVVHFAAESHVDRSIESAGEFIQTDVYGTFILLERARRENIKRFIQISTDEVYGTIPPGRSSKENDALMPRNPYSASKTGADRLAYSYSTTYDLPVLITRSSNNFGPYQYPEKLIPLFATNILRGKKVPLYGDGKNIRDWLYVMDNCSAIDMVLQKGKIGDVYNIGGGNEKENIFITNLILEILGKDQTWIEHVQDRQGHDRRYSLDSSKIKNELGWEPNHDFSKAMKETVQWYYNNEDWWKPLLKS